MILRLGFTIKGIVKSVEFIIEFRGNCEGLCGGSGGLAKQVT